MVNLSNVMEAVVEVTGVPSYQVIGKSRMKEIAMARHLFCYMARLHTNASLLAIGEFLGGRHHSTVIHSIRTANDMLDTDYEVFGDMVNQCNNQIAAKWKQDFTFTVTIPYGVEFTKVKQALEVFGVEIV
jgi:chromosomal replication initiation ATPase DnaA